MLASGSAIANQSISSTGSSKRYSRPTPAYSVQVTREPSTRNGASGSPLPDGVISAAAKGVHDYRTALDKAGAVDWLEGKKHPAKIGQKIPLTVGQDVPLESPTFADSERYFRILERRVRDAHLSLRVFQSECCW
jgi:hypothetical protein